MSSRNRADVKKLFEFWAEVTRAHGVDRSTSTGAAAPAGIILESFPECYRDEKTIADVPDFAFPCDFVCDSVQSYSFVLTTDDSKWRYGFCRHDPKTDSAMVIVTYLPWHDIFLRMLSVLAELRRSSNEEFRTFISDVYNRGMPDPGGSVTVLYSGSQSPFVFERPLQFQLPSIPENQMLSLYYNFVDPKNMIAIFAAMLAERRIIFTSRRLDRLSSCIQAANAFLYPMVWQHIFIPVLPMKLKDYLCAPMPYLIGVPEMVLETMTPEELGEVVILYCDRKVLESPFDDVHEMPAEIVSQLKKQLSHSHEHLGDRVSKIFLGALVQLIGGYRDAVEFRGTGKSFNRDKFIETRPANLRPFLAKMMELQIFQQFIDERIDMLNTGLGFSDEFEKETVRYAEKIKKRGRNYAFLKNVKEKTNPAVKSAVKSVKEGSRGVKTAYKDLKSKLRDITPPSSSNSHFRSHLSATNSQHDRIDGFIVVGGGGKLPVGGHHSAPSSPIFNNRTYQHSVGFQYAASPAALTVPKNPPIRKAPPLASSNSTSHIQPNGYANCISASVTNTTGGHLTVSPTDSPASSLCSSEMNLSQELQNHPLFKSPIVDRSLKPNSGGLEINSRAKAGRLGVGVPPPTQQLPSSTLAHIQKSVIQRPSEVSPYHNHRYVVTQQQHVLQQQKLQQQQHRLLQPKAKSYPQTSISSTYAQTHPPVANKPSLAPRPALNKSSNIAQTSAVPTINNKIITTGSIFDNPPDMLSPPVPPRRSGIVDVGAPAGTNNSHYNCHNINGINRVLSGKQSDIELRDSPFLDTSATSSSSAPFVSVASAFSHQQQPQHACRKEMLLPVPAPRLKKESLRSLQPYHVPPLTHSDNRQENTEALPSPVSTKDSVNDLISLDDSTNSSFDLEDFDPLNKNARPLPSLVGAGSGSGVAKKTNITPVSTSSTAANPLYPYYTPQHTPLLPPTIKPPPPPTGVTPYDDDFELLRKYGLDQFTLSPNIAATTTHSSKTFKNNTATSNIILKSTTQNSKCMNNWTTFD